MRRVSIVLLLTIAIVMAVNIIAMSSNLPISRQGTLVESVSPSELLIYATGISKWKKGDSKARDIDNYLLRYAENDARKAAVYFVLFGGTDPLLASEKERNAFNRIQEDFFQIDNVRKYIAWEGHELIKRTKREVVKKREYELTIDKAFKINKQEIQDYLVKSGILTARETLADAVGLPFLMVIPAVTKGKNPIETLKGDARQSHAAKVIESYLTARRYDVFVPEQSVDLNELASAQKMVKDVADDLSYQLALSIGSDVYITYEINIEADKYNTKKASASVRAFETTTARLLGTETGYSPSSQASDMVLIEQAVNDAIDKVLNRINAYWKEDIGRGVQYKVIVSIEGGFDVDQTEDIAFVLGDVLREISKNGRYKENVVTGQTLDYIVWCDANSYGQSSQLYRHLRQKFSEKFPSGSLRQINLNRKMALLKVEAN